MGSFTITEATKKRQRASVEEIQRIQEMIIDEITQNPTKQRGIVGLVSAITGEDPYNKEGLRVRDVINRMRRQKIIGKTPGRKAYWSVIKKKTPVKPTYKRPSKLIDVVTHTKPAENIAVRKDENTSIKLPGGITINITINK